MAKDSNKYIVRREIKSTRGWEVRVVRNKGTVRELFSDLKYGGKNNVLREARKFRNTVLRRIPLLSRREIAGLPKKTNIDEGVGISLVKQTTKRGNKKYSYLFYQAFWSPKKGAYKSKKFSIAKYGKKIAYKLAATARLKGLNKMSK